MMPSNEKPIRFERDGMEAAMQRAADRARDIGRRTGTPVWVMVDGKLVDVLAEERAQQNGKSPAVSGTH
jgi:hypothetical protein